MATSNDHPGLPYVHAAGYTRGRPDGPALWIVVHDMEASEWSGRAESTAAYFANPSDGRQVSAHFCVDDNSVIQCVDEDDSAWTVGNRPGNNRGINWELSGFARQTRAEWLDPFGVAMLAQMAPIAAASMLRWGIPNRWCTVADLIARRPGLTTHNDLRIAFGVTTHTDPGSGFPRDYLTQVLAAALNPQEDDMLIRDETGAIWTVDPSRLWRRYIDKPELDKTWVGVPYTAVAKAEVDAGWWGRDIATMKGDKGDPGPAGVPGVGFAPGETVMLTGTATVADN